MAKINTIFAQTLSGKNKIKCACGQEETKPEMCHAIWLGYPIPNPSENMKPQCYNENSFIYIIIEHNQHWGEKKKKKEKSKYTAPILRNCQPA